MVRSPQDKTTHWYNEFMMPNSVMSCEMVNIVPENCSKQMSLLLGTKFLICFLDIIGRARHNRTLVRSRISHRQLARVVIAEYARTNKPLPREVRLMTTEPFKERKYNTSQPLSQDFITQYTILYADIMDTPIKDWIGRIAIENLFTTTLTINEQYKKFFVNPRNAPYQDGGMQYNFTVSGHSQHGLNMAVDRADTCWRKFNESMEVCRDSDEVLSVLEFIWTEMVENSNETDWSQIASDFRFLGGVHNLDVDKAELLSEFTSHLENFQKLVAQYPQQLLDIEKVIRQL